METRRPKLWEIMGVHQTVDEGLEVMSNLYERGRMDRAIHEYIVDPFTYSDVYADKTQLRYTVDLRGPHFLRIERPTAATVFSMYMHGVDSSFGYGYYGLEGEYKSHLVIRDEMYEFLDLLSANDIYQSMLRMLSWIAADDENDGGEFMEGHINSTLFESMTTDLVDYFISRGGEMLLMFVQFVIDANVIPVRFFDENPSPTTRIPLTRYKLESFAVAIGKILKSDTKLYESTMANIESSLYDSVQAQQMYNGIMNVFEDNDDCKRAEDINVIFFTLLVAAGASRNDLERSINMYYRCGITCEELLLAMSEERGQVYGTSTLLQVEGSFNALYAGHESAKAKIVRQIITSCDKPLREYKIEDSWFFDQLKGLYSSIREEV